MAVGQTQDLTEILFSCGFVLPEEHLLLDKHLPFSPQCLEIVRFEKKNK